MSGQIFEWVKTVGALILLALAVIVLWVVVSPIAFGIKLVLQGLGYERGLEWTRQHLAAVRPFNGWRTAYGLLGGGAVPAEKHVRLIVDERLKALTRALRQTVDSVSKASLELIGLGGTAGPGALTTDLQAMQRQIEELATLGGEIEEDMIRHYQGRSTATFMFYTCLVLAVIFCAVNGTLLNLFFEGVFTTRVLGVPASYPVAIGFILAELGLGIATAYFTQRESAAMRVILVGLIVIAALFEGIIFAIVSNGFDLDIALFDEYPWMKSWMGILGLLFVTATATIGYILHQTRHQIGEHKGALRLRHDVAMTNGFIRGLPARWDDLRRKAQAAEQSINSYVLAIGNRSDALKGAVDRIATERETIVRALAEARIDDWRDWLDGEAGDRRHHGSIQIGLALLALVLIGMFVWGFSTVLEGISYPQIPPLACWAGALLTAAAFCTTGLLSLGRIQVSETGKNRVYALRSEPWEYVVGSLAGSCAVIAVLWASTMSSTAPGIAFGLLLVAGGGGLAACGYYLDQVAAGLIATLRVIVSSLLAAFTAVVLLLLVLLGWPLWVVAWLAFFVLSVLAWPAEKLLEHLRARRGARGSGPQATRRESLA